MIFVVAYAYTSYLNTIKIVSGDPDETTLEGAV